MNFFKRLLRLFRRKPSPWRPRGEDIGFKQRPPDKTAFNLRR